MKYDLTSKSDRLRFIKRANSLLQNKRTVVNLMDESSRTLKQNSYIHVLCRIMANETGQTESYAKEIYLKKLANRELFERVSKDPISGQIVSVTRSISDLTIPELRKAITGFRNWAADNGYYLPNATVNDDGSVTFATDSDKQAFHKALIHTSDYS